MALSIEDVRNMSGEEINERWAEVQEVLAVAGQDQEGELPEELDWEAIRRMTRDEIIERWEEVAAVLGTLTLRKPGG